MKKLLISILSIFIFFSIANKSIAEEWYIEKILDLNYWIEDYKLNLPNIEYRYFYNKNILKAYNSFKKTDKLLKDEIIKKYRNNEIDYYKMNWIVLNYNNFVYHTNKFFKYLSIKEIQPNSKEVNQAILNNYELSRNYYKRTKYLILSN